MIDILFEEYKNCENGSEKRIIADKAKLNLTSEDYIKFIDLAVKYNYAVLDNMKYVVKHIE